MSTRIRVLSHLTTTYTPTRAKYNIARTGDVYRIPPHSTRSAPPSRLDAAYERRDICPALIAERERGL